jgi:hypothetical protein
MSSLQSALVFGEFIDGAILWVLVDDVIVVGISAGRGEDEGVCGQCAAERVEGLTGGDYEGCFLLEV